MTSTLLCFQLRPALLVYARGFLRVLLPSRGVLPNGRSLAPFLSPFLSLPRHLL